MKGSSPSAWYVRSWALWHQPDLRSQMLFFPECLSPAIAQEIYQTHSDNGMILNVFSYFSNVESYKRKKGGELGICWRGCFFYARPVWSDHCSEELEMLLSEAFLNSHLAVARKWPYAQDENLSCSLAHLLHVGYCRREINKRNKSVEEKSGFIRHLRRLWKENSRWREASPWFQSFTSAVF